MPLVDPYEVFWERAQQVELTPQEEEYQREAQQAPVSLAKVAAGLGAAFFLYKLYMTRRLLEEAKKNNVNDPNTLGLIAAALYQGFVPRWVGITTPLLIAGYMQGMREARMGEVPEQVLNDIATAYATNMGSHINDVSYQAMMEGFYAQVNRKVPAARAAERVAKSYGVTPRAMNAIVSTLTLEDPKRLVAAPVLQVQDSRIGAIVRADVARRAEQIGESEAWAAKSQAKQIVWMYGQAKGVIPEHAKRIWITAKDEKVCKVCGPLHKKKVEVGEKFETKSGDYWSPPTHINCRCDIILDFDLTDDLQDELTEMLQEETVSKAADDPRTAYWDARDTKGKFARATTALKEDPRIVVPGIEIPDAPVVPIPQEYLDLDTNVKVSSGKIRSATKLSSGKLKALPKVSSSDLKVSAKDQKIESQKIRTQKLQSVKLPSATELLRSRPKSEPKTKGEVYHLDVPLMALIEDQEADATSWMVDGDQPFLQLDDSSRPKGMGQMQVIVDHYWDSWMERETSMWEGDVYYGPEDVEYEVDVDAYEAALVETINNVPHAGSTKVTLTGRRGEQLTMTAYELAQHLGLEGKVYDERPLIIITQHGRPNETRPNHDYRGSDIWMNPGKWEEQVEYEEHDQVLSHKPYRIVWVEPMD